MLEQVLTLPTQQRYPQHRLIDTKRQVHKQVSRQVRSASVRVL